VWWAGRLTDNFKSRRQCGHWAFMTVIQFQLAAKILNVIKSVNNISSKIYQVKRRYTVYCPNQKFQSNLLLLYCSWHMPLYKRHMKINFTWCLPLPDPWHCTTQSQRRACSCIPYSTFACKEVYSSLCYKHRTTMGTHVPYGLWDHTVLPANRQRWHSRLYPSQLRLVLDLATPEGCKAELT